MEKYLGMNKVPSLQRSEVSRYGGKQSVNKEQLLNPNHYNGSFEPAWPRVESSGTTLLSCPYQQVGCEFQAATESEVNTHCQLPVCQANHNALLLGLMGKLKSHVGKIDTTVEALRVSTLDRLNDRSEKNTSSSSQSMAMEVDGGGGGGGNQIKKEYVIPPEIEKLINKFPLANVKTYHMLFAVQTEITQLRQEFNKEKAQTNSLREQLLLLQNESSKSKQQQQHYTNTPAAFPDDLMVKADSLDITQDRVDSNTVTLDAVDSNKTRIGYLEHKVEELEKTCKELREDKDRCKQLERFVMHLHERIKSLDCGRTGRFIWKISGFNTIFENAQSQNERKLNGIESMDGADNPPIDFCSPLFYTSPHGYLMYMRLYPYGCDSAAGKFISLFIAMSPGEYDGVLPWPFRDTIEISLLSQDGSGDKWTQTITPGGNNLTCFERPSSKSGNMSVGILHFIVHEKIYTKESAYAKNDTIFIEVRIRENENCLTGPPKAKAARPGF